MTISKDAINEKPDCKEWSSGSYYSQHHSLRKLSPLEKKFLLAVEHGNAATVHRMLSMLSRDDKLPLDVNCKDPVGRSALLMAIDNENLEMLEILLENGMEIRDALLHAINTEYVEAVELLLDHEEIVHKEGEPHSWEKVERDISSFTPEITPLILAAHKDNYEILKILLDRGATLPMPHDVRCRCRECVQAMEEDCLCHSRSRINAYRALSSPSLICLSSIDPILTAFELSWELRRLSLAENEFKEDYQKLRFRCQDFATSLLAQTRSSRELGVILNHDPTRFQCQEDDTMSLNRVEMAIKYKQKKFIAHPNVQQLLSTLWYDGLPGFRRLNALQQAWEFMKIGVLFPIYAIIYMIFPNNEKSKLIRKPFFKFISHSFSYLFFLFLLILASQRVETVLVQLFGTENMKLQLMETLKMQRGQPPTIIETSILLFIIAHIWQETRELWRKGLVEYFKNMWNLIDFTRNCLHVGTALLRVLAYLQAQSEIRSNPMAVYIPREAWGAFDPMLIADGLFAAGNVFAALKLVHIFSINPYLGPLQISLGRMVIDIIKFFFIYTLVLFAFACGLNQLLWYYADREKKQCFTGPGGTENWVTQRDSCLAWRRFSNLFESSQTLFWASFGLVDINTFELSGIKTYTRFWGLLMFGSYSVINVVVLLNLLIAMMSNSYQIISERADEEWKFARTRLFMNYFEEGGTIPPPFNLFPTVKNIKRIFSKNQHSYKDMSIKNKEAQMKERDTIYQSVMCNLVWRYVTAQQKACESDPVTEDDIKELRQDINSFRHDMMHVFRCNGMNTKDISMDKIDVPPGKKIQIRERRLIKDFSIGLMEVYADDAAPEIKGSNSVLARLVGHRDTGNSQRWRDLIQLAKKSRIIESKSSNIGEDERGNNGCNQDDLMTNEINQTTDAVKFNSALISEEKSNSIQKETFVNETPTSMSAQQGELGHQNNLLISQESTFRVESSRSMPPKSTNLSSASTTSEKVIKKRQSTSPPPPNANNLRADNNLMLSKTENMTKTKLSSAHMPPPVTEMPTVTSRKIKIMAPMTPSDKKTPTTLEKKMDAIRPVSENIETTTINVPPSPTKSMKTVVNMPEEKQTVHTSTVIEFSGKETALVAINVDNQNNSKADKQHGFPSTNSKTSQAILGNTEDSTLITVNDTEANDKIKNTSQLQPIISIPVIDSEKGEVAGKTNNAEQNAKALPYAVCPMKVTQHHGWI